MNQSTYRAITSRVWSIKGCIGDDASNHCCSDISQRQVESGGVMDGVAEPGWCCGGLERGAGGARGGRRLARGPARRPRAASTPPTSDAVLSPEIEYVLHATNRGPNHR
ncbi:hypothetical protein JYU34_005279 [Plutella xylostella]|uniref:Uncharacterized protein n=1 Tax=Plutella xylostella TaxID=51655 RepID=A0ABQ7QWA8_PLUXY|nr:hypothetical protein JYU34_005279 [Plutella xylostella]